MHCHANIHHEDACIFHRIPASALIYDVATLRIKAASDQFLAFYGYSESEILEMELPDLFPETIRSTCRDHIGQCGKMEGEQQHLRKNGEIIYVTVRTEDIFHSGAACRIAVITDISGFKASEQALSREHFRMRTLVHSIPDLVWFKDEKGIYQFCNQAFEGLYGAPESEIVGKTDYDFIDKETADFFRENDRLAAGAGKPRKNEEWLRYADGSYSGLFETIKTPVFDGENHFTGVLGIARDITALRKSQKDLRKRVREQQCLYRIFSVTENIELPLDETIKDVIGEIPGGWQYPEKAAVRIEYNNEIFSGSNFVAAPCMLTVATQTGQKENLSISVACLEEKKESEEPFLEEERKLLEAILGRLSDVIDRRNAAARLKERELLVNTMFDQTTDSIVLVDTQTLSFIDFNTASHRDLGYAREEFFGLRFNDIQGEYTSEEITENLLSALSGEKIGFETVHKHEDGTLRNVKLTLRSIGLGGKLLASGVWRDITERKKRDREIENYRLRLEDLVSDRTAELNLINNEQKAIFDSATVGIILIRNEVILRCNRKMEQMFGYSSEELLHIPVKTLVDGTDTALSIEQADLDLPETGTFRMEIEVRRKDQSRFWARVTGQALKQGSPEEGLVAIIEDISAEKDYRQTLQKARDAAEEATEAKSLFLANMSHEIRTPLNAIIGMSHLVLQTELTPKQNRFISRINRSGQHLLGIVTDILDFSRIEAGKLSLEKAEFGLEQILENTAVFMNEKAADKNLEIIIEMDRNIPQTIMGDPLRLTQVLLNLGSNACKFTEKGEICISVHIKDRTEDGIILHFSVKDTGIGITEEQLSHLFQSFQQANMSITRKYEGTGLGLVICKRLVTLMKGEMGLHSEFGKGSEFWFTIPFEVSDGNRKSQITDSTMTGKKVLIADDNEHARNVLNEMLSSFRFDVHETSSVNYVMEELIKSDEQNSPYEIVFLDLPHSEQDGMLPVRKINELPLRAAPHIILLTAEHVECPPDELKKMGVKEILVKPVTPSVLFNATVKILREAEEYRIQKQNISMPEIEDRLATIRGAHILLVEDNEINQEVAIALLTEVGMFVDTAENGVIALNLLKTKNYDLILMDVQMPVMDGISTTVEIRKNHLLKDLPVIAMTANTMQQDKTACLAIGMNDFISKPINPPVLWQTLLQWIRPSGKYSKTPRKTRTETAVSPIPANIDGIDTKLGLERVLHKEELYISLLRKFKNEKKRFADDMYSAIQEGDMKTAGLLAHSLKGVAGNIGATKIQTISAELEKAIKDGENKERLMEIADQVCITLIRLIHELDINLPEAEVWSNKEINKKK